MISMVLLAMDAPEHSNVFEGDWEHHQVHTSKRNSFIALLPANRNNGTVSAETQDPQPWRVSF